MASADMEERVESLEATVFGESRCYGWAFSTGLESRLEAVEERLAELEQRLADLSAQRVAHEVSE